MGVVVSSTSTTSPFFLTTSIIGLVSFAFTVSTFLRVVWVNLETMTESPHVVHTYLTNLRTELLEEKANIRIMRKQARRHHRAIRRGEVHLSESTPGMELDDVSLKTMGDIVRHLIRQFKELEQPFLEPGSDGVDGWKQHRRRRRRGSSASPYYQHSAYASPPSPPDKGARGGKSEHGRGRRGDREEDEDEEDAFWAQRTDYASLNLRRRLVWVRRKAEAQTLFDTLSRVQIRRIARQVGGLTVALHEYGTCSLQTQEVLRRVDERMNTIVGVRRVD